MFEELAQILKENYQIENIELSTDFKKDLDLTSFDFVNIIALIEDKYGIEIEEESYRSLNTVQELKEYLEGRIRQRENA